MPFPPESVSFRPIEEAVEEDPSLAFLDGDTLRGGGLMVPAYSYGVCGAGEEGGGQ